MSSDFRRELDEVRQEYWEELGIGERGYLSTSDGKRLKFETKPYIGSKYGDASKIVFVGHDVGKEEKRGGFQGYDERRQAIERPPVKYLNDNPHNSHIPGTYLTALFLLREEEGWEDFWKEMENEEFDSFRTALRECQLPRDNPLSYVALVNYWKLVDPRDEDGRGGKKDVDYYERQHLSLLSKELDALGPDMVVFQSNKYHQLLALSQIVAPEIYAGPHPSYSKSGGPREYLNNKLWKV